MVAVSNLFFVFIINEFDAGRDDYSVAVLFDVIPKDFDEGVHLFLGSDLADVEHALE